MKYQFEINMTDKNYYDFNKWCMFNLPANKKANLRGRLWVPVIFMFFLLLDFITGKELEYIGFGFVLYAVVSIIWILVFKYLVLGILKMKIKGIKKSGKLLYSKVANVQFLEDSIIEVTDKKRIELLYTAISDIAIDKGKSIYIFENHISAIIIPFTVFKTDEEREEFINFINEKSNKVSN